tara:strand:+ start:16 stop:987 length:972 start_codon:yes stop_codon:yes gene_type:complete
MDAGAFRVFLLILASTVELWADGVAIPAATTNATTTVTNAVSITTNSPSVTTNTVLVPEVVGSTNSPSVTTNTVLVPEVVGLTNAPLVASGTNSVAEVKQEIPANLGAFSVIPRNDPFRLTKPEPEEAEPEIVAPRTVGVPQLAGISTLRGNQRAVLRISPPRGGKAEYVFLAVGDELHGVEVTKIDLSQGLVEVLVRGQTFPLELDKKSDAGNGSTVSVVRPSGSNYRPGIGGEAEKPSKAGNNPKPPPGNGLKPVPTRTRPSIQPSLEYPAPFGTGRFEPPQFDQRLQKYLTDPASLSTQREIVRGQVSSESPTDIPKHER